MLIYWLKVARVKLQGFSLQNQNDQCVFLPTLNDTESWKYTEGWVPQNLSQVYGFRMTLKREKEEEISSFLAFAPKQPKANPNEPISVALEILFCPTGFFSIRIGFSKSQSSLRKQRQFEYLMKSEKKWQRESGRREKREGREKGMKRRGNDRGREGGGGNGVRRKWIREGLILGWLDDGIEEFVAFFLQLLNFLLLTLDYDVEFGALLFGNFLQIR